MKILLSFIALSIAITFFIFNITTNEIKINDKEILNIISTQISKQDNEFTVLFKESIKDEREGINILTIITASKMQPILSNETPLTVNFQTALNVIKIDLPNYDFGKSINDDATSYHWNKDAQWSVQLLILLMDFIRAGNVLLIYSL